MGILWFCALLLTHGVAYFWGASNASDEAQMYEIDRKYEFMMWLHEREEKHDLPDA